MEPFSIVKSSSKGPFSIAMLVYQSVIMCVPSIFSENPKQSINAFAPPRTVGGVVGVAMNSVLLVHEHPED